MDIDAIVQTLPVTQEEIEKIVNEIGGIPLEDKREVTGWVSSKVVTTKD